MLFQRFLALLSSKFDKFASKPYEILHWIQFFSKFSHTVRNNFSPTALWVRHQGTCQNDQECLGKCFKSNWILLHIRMSIFITSAKCLQYLYNQMNLCSLFLMINSQFNVFQETENCSVGRKYHVGDIIHVSNAGETSKPFITEAFFNLQIWSWCELFEGNIVPTVIGEQFCMVTL